MEKYAKRLQDIINEQDFCFEPEEIRTVEKALGVLKKYEDADIPAEACAEYRKFEDELIRDGMSLQHVLDLLKAEKEGRLKVRPESLGQCCGQCHHFLREPMKASGICEVRKNKHYPRAGTPLYCCQSKKPALTSTSAASGPSGIRRHDDGAPDDTKQRRHGISADRHDGRSPCSTGWPTTKTPTGSLPRSASWNGNTARPSMNCAICAVSTSRNTKEPAADAGGKNLCDRR